MAHNVRCAGGGSWRALDESEGYGVGVPCGWTGDRKPHPAYGVPTKTLPCPRCGGTVALTDPPGFGEARP